MSMRFRLLRDFLESDTLLLLATPAQVLELADRIDAADLSTSKPVDLKQWGWTSPDQTSAELIAAQAGSSVDVYDGGRRLVWRLAASEKESVVRKLRNVGNNPRPGHEFLETEGDYQIMVSKGEYSDSVLD